MKNCDDMRDYNINGRRKRKIVNPALEREKKNNVQTPVTPTPIPIQKRSGFVAPAPPQFDPTITRLGLPQEKIAPIYTQENAKKLKLTKEQQLENQAKNLQYDNFQTISWTLNNIESASSTFIKQDYNQSYDSAVGLQGYISFGDYYNILGIECQLYNLSANISVDGSNYVEWLLMREATQDAAGTSIYPPISPTSIESDMSGSLSGFPTEQQVGSDQFGQSFICHLNRSNYFIGSGRPDYTPRTYGIALKGIRIHFQNSQNTSLAIIGFTAYLAKDTVGKTL